MNGQGGPAVRGLLSANCAPRVLGMETGFLVPILPPVRLPALSRDPQAGASLLSVNDFTPLALV